MSQWWKSIQDKLGRATPGILQPLSLRERLEQEQARQRRQEKLSANRGPDATLSPGESMTEAEAQNKRVLLSLLGWKLEVKKDISELSGNPSKVDGYWFGVKRYWRFARNENEQDELSWKLHFYKPCTHCRALFPTIELGDYMEIKIAAEKMMLEGQEVLITKSTARLASYLNDLEAGRPDPHCPRMCPACRKLIKGGTI